MRRQGRGRLFVLNGTKLFVPDAHVADYMLVAARTKKGADPEDGITLLLVDSKSPGIEYTPLKTIGRGQAVRGDVQQREGAQGQRPGRGGQGLADPQQGMQLKATVAECAYMVGLAQMDFEISVDYAKERVQFGRPIGTFQAIQHKCADMVTDVDGSRFIMYKAAWSIAGERAGRRACWRNMAKAWCSEATRRVVAHGQQIHGGIGFTKDYKIQLYFRRQKRMELMWGDADYHRELVAQQLES